MGAQCRPSFAYGEKSVSIGDQCPSDRMEDTSGFCFTHFPVRKGNFSQNDNLCHHVLGAVSFWFLRKQPENVTKRILWN